MHREPVDPQYIRFKERAKIRDLFIPLSRDEGSAGCVIEEAHLHQAYCYVGDTEPRMMFDGRDPELIAWIMEIYSKSDTAKSSGLRNWRIEHENQMFRAHIAYPITGPELVLRALPDETPTLTQLRMPGYWREIMLDPNLLYGGLVLMSAKNGQGKTTTCSAMVRSRLERFAGHANTLEDPPELPLHGWFGRGVCRQTQAGGTSGQGDFAEGLVNMRREFPAMTGGGTIMMIGEIRDNKTAAETLLAAFEGHLVIATFHSSSLQHALQRLTSMAGQEIGSDQARELLSQTLRACFNQHLSLQEGTGWDRGTLKGKVLVVPSGEHPVAKAIRDHKQDTLANLIREQERIFSDLPDTATIADVNAAIRKQS